jgi:hypothetical protein
MKFEPGDIAMTVTTSGILPIGTIVTITDVHRSFNVCDFNGIAQFLTDDELEPINT